MNEKASFEGMVWFLHHDLQLEWCYYLNYRIEYINVFKPEEERETRLRWLKPVEGKLTEEVVKAAKALSKLYYAHMNTHTVSEYYELRTPYLKAKYEYKKVLETHAKEIDGLFKIECPGCPWDGATLFGNGARIKEALINRQ